MRQGLTIGETAKLLNMSTSQIRFYEKKGLLKPHRVQDSKYRHFSFEDIDRLEMIHAFRQLEIPISEIEELLSDDEDFDYIELMDTTINRIEAQILRLKKTKELAIRLKTHYTNFITSNPQIIDYPQRTLYIIDDEPTQKRTEKDLYDFVNYYKLDYTNHNNVIYTLQDKSTNLLCAYNPQPMGSFDMLDTFTLASGKYFSINLVIPPNTPQNDLYKKLVHACRESGHEPAGIFITIEDLNNYSKNMIYLTLQVLIK